MASRRTVSRATATAAILVASTIVASRCDLAAGFVPCAPVSTRGTLTPMAAAADGVTEPEVAVVKSAADDAAPKNGTTEGAVKKNGKKKGKAGKGGKKGSMLNTKRSTHGKKNGKHFAPTKPLSELRPGKQIIGYVAGITPFGAFIKTEYRLKGGGGGRKGNGGGGGGGGDAGYALLHKSQISDDRVEKVEDVLRVGQRLEGLRVVDVNYAKGEVGLSLRSPRPKRAPVSSLRAGQEVRGRVSALVPYGAFVDVGCKSNALLHVSRISADKVTDVSDHLEVGEWVDVRILDVDAERGTVACSMLERKADEYLDRRRKNRMRKKKLDEVKEGKRVGGGGSDDEDGEEDLKGELKFFEEAIRELEEAFK